MEDRRCARVYPVSAAYMLRRVPPLAASIADMDATRGGVYDGCFVSHKCHLWSLVYGAYW